MNFKDHLSMIGFSFDPEKRTCQLEDVERFTNNIDIVGALLNPLTAAFCVKDEGLRKRFTKLHDQFVSGKVEHDWDVQVADCVREFVEKGGADAPGFDDSFSRISDYAMADYSGRTIEVEQQPAPEPVKSEPVKQTSGTQPLSGGTADKRESFMAEEDLSSLGWDGWDIDPEGLDPHDIAPILYAMHHISSQFEISTKDELKKLEDAYFDRKIIGNDWTARACEALAQTYHEIGTDVRAKKFFDHQYRPMINVARNKTESVRGDVRTTAQISAQMDVVDAVMDIKKKMDAESFGPHINSSEYKEMKAAVNRVSDLIKNGYDPKDPDSMREMTEALDKVNKTAAKYAEKKVVGKTKKTDRGIDRKNTALALMQATDPKSVDAIMDQIVDFRLDAKHDMKDKVGRTKVSFTDLMEAEKKTNQRVDEGYKKKAARSTAAGDVRYERMKKNMAEGIDDRPIFKK